MGVVVPKCGWTNHEASLEPVAASHVPSAHHCWSSCRITAIRTTTALVKQEDDESHDSKRRLTRSSLATSIKASAKVIFKFIHGYCAREIVIVGVSVVLSGILAAFFFVCSPRTA